MTAYHIKSQRLPRWAKIGKNGSIAWGKRESATEFGSSGEARAAAIQAIKLTYAKARAATLRKLQAAGAKCSDHNVWWDLPTWLRPVGRELRSAEECSDASALPLFTIDSAAAEEDALGVFDSYYAKGPRGWLGGPKVQARWGRCDWHPMFAEALSFSSEVAAREAAALAMGAEPFSILKSTSAFTKVELAPSGADEVSLSVAAACEARQIEDEIHAAGKSRVDAVRAGGQSRGRI